MVSSVVMSPAPALDKIESSAPSERSRQKDLGAFYSPEALVKPIVRWAVRKKSDSILDPSCGDGVFLATAGERLVHLGALPKAAAEGVHGFDLNPKAIEVTAEALSAALGIGGAHLTLTDFFAIQPQRTVDVVLGNPPYVRYQKFNGSVRIQALAKAEAAGARLSRLTSSWAPFVAHAISFTRFGGRLAFILPAELVHAAYARPLRNLLRKSFDEVSVIHFRKAVFPGVQEEVVILLADRRVERAEGRLRLVEAATAEDLSNMESLLARAEIFERGEEPVKWIPGYTKNRGVSCLHRLRGEGLFVSLDQVGKAGIGFVSGANDFFVLSPREAARWSLPKRSLRPCLVKARQIPGPFISTDHLSALQAADESCLLWLPEKGLSSKEKAYIRHGESLGLHQRYKCRVREPWYLVPGVAVPDAFLTYMSDVVPRLCLNEAGLTAANTLLTVRLPSVPRDLLRVFVTAFFNSATLLSCELVGRSYGGGVLKLEPREADKIAIPSISVVASLQDPLAEIAAKVEQEIRGGRAGDLKSAIQLVNRILLRDGCGLAESDIHGLETARQELLERRQSRSLRASGVVG